MKYCRRFARCRAAYRIHENAQAASAVLSASEPGDGNWRKDTGGTGAVTEAPAEAVPGPYAGAAAGESGAPQHARGLLSIWPPIRERE